MQNLSLAMALLAAAPSNAQSLPDCPGIAAISVIDRFAELPEDIRNDLRANFSRMAKGREPLLETDAPSAAEMKYPTSRFVRAVLMKNVWYVQMQVSMTEGVRTIG
jgi:hypothetical protein